MLLVILACVVALALLMRHTREGMLMYSDRIIVMLRYKQKETKFTFPRSRLTWSDICGDRKAARSVARMLAFLHVTGYSLTKAKEALQRVQQSQDPVVRELGENGVRVAELTYAFAMSGNGSFTVSKEVRANPCFVDGKWLC